jgi:hypothetical protein
LQINLVSKHVEVEERPDKKSPEAPYVLRLAVWEKQPEPNQGNSWDVSNPVVVLGAPTPQEIYIGFDSDAKLKRWETKLQSAWIDRMGMISTMWLAKEGDIVGLELLVDADELDLDLQDNKAWTAAMHAAAAGQVECLLLLAQKSADLNTQNLHGECALHLAIRENHPACVDALIENGVDLNVQADDGNSALFICVQGGQLSLLRKLIDAGSDTSLLNSMGYSALIISAQRGFIDCLELLIAHADIDQAHPATGNTAVMWAALTGSDMCLKMLVEAGAQLPLKNNSKQTALDIARENGNEAAVKLLGLGFPRFSMPPSSMMVEVGDTVLLECVIAMSTARPYALKWERKYVPVENEEGEMEKTRFEEILSDEMGDGEGDFTASLPVQVSDTAEATCQYRCTCSNSRGEMKSEIATLRLPTVPVILTEDGQPQLSMCRPGRKVGGLLIELIDSLDEGEWAINRLNRLVRRR